MKFTPMQVEELMYKLEIVADEDDLLESYGYSAEEIEEIRAQLATGSIELDEKSGAMFYEELQNLVDIAEDNHDGLSSSEKRQNRSYINQMKKAMIALREAGVAST